MSDFMECDTCRAKPGSPVLCEGCGHNRALIEMLRQALDEAEMERSNLIEVMKSKGLLRERAGEDR